jgi:hypothetical protein
MKCHPQQENDQKEQAAAGNSEKEAKGLPGGLIIEKVQLSPFPDCKHAFLISMFRGKLPVAAKTICKFPPGNENRRRPKGTVPAFPVLF